MATLAVEIGAVIEAGADVSVSAKDYLAVILGGFAEKAAQYGRVLTVREAGSLLAVLQVEIAKKGKGHVRFEY